MVYGCRRGNFRKHDAGSGCRRVLFAHWRGRANLYRSQVRGGGPVGPRTLRHRAGAGGRIRTARLGRPDPGSRSPAAVRRELSHVLGSGTCASLARFTVAGSGRGVLALARGLDRRQLVRARRPRHVHARRPGGDLSPEVVGLRRQPREDRSALRLVLELSSKADGAFRLRRDRRALAGSPLRASRPGGRDEHPARRGSWLFLAATAGRTSEVGAAGGLFLPERCEIGPGGRTFPP